MLIVWSPPLSIEPLLIQLLLSSQVNQGYARPYGASQPPAASPKSPVPSAVSYPPQQQQQSPRPAGNAYATLPRSNVGQQGKTADDEYLSEGEWV